MVSGWRRDGRNVSRFRHSFAARDRRPWEAGANVRTTLHQVKSAVARDLHEWVSFEDPDEDRTWVFDLTFLMSSWTCIFGRGCPGVLTGPAEELEQGCCSYGAHFTGPEDRAHVEEMAAKLTADEWQLKKQSAKRGGPIKVNKDGEIVSRLVDGACVFLNRPGFPGGAGCALHRAALERGERPIDWKPEVCWQLPLRRVDETDPYGHVTSTVREWKRRDWGPGGDEFHWWCTSDEGAFIDVQPVHETMRDELVELCGAKPVQLFLQHTQERDVTWLPHPVLKNGRKGST